MNIEAYQCLYDSLIFVHTNNREGHSEEIVYHSLRTTLLVVSLSKFLNRCRIPLVNCSEIYITI